MLFILQFNLSNQEHLENICNTLYKSKTTLINILTKNFMFLFILAAIFVFYSLSIASNKQANGALPCTNHLQLTLSLFRATIKF